MCLSTVRGFEQRRLGKQLCSVRAEVEAQDPFPAPPPPTQPSAQAAPRPRPPSLFQQGCQSILQVNTAINNGVKRPSKRGGGGVRLCLPPGSEDPVNGSGRRRSLRETTTPPPPPPQNPGNSVGIWESTPSGPHRQEAGDHLRGVRKLSGVWARAEKERPSVLHLGCDPVAD